MKTNMWTILFIASLLMFAVGGMLAWYIACFKFNEVNI